MMYGSGSVEAPFSSASVKLRITLYLVLVTFTLYSTLSLSLTMLLSFDELAVSLGRLLSPQFERTKYQ